MVNEKLTRSSRVSRLIQMICILLLANVSVSMAQDRTALLIANSDYGEHRLPHVQADAEQVARALKQDGFRITSHNNLDANAMKEAVRKFADETATNGVALIYFAGHAGQYKTYSSKGASWNYLQGSGKPDNRLDRSSLAVPDIVRDLHRYEAARTNLIIIDAPHSNPFHDDKRPKGLAEITSGQLGDDTLVITSIAPGKLAAEGASERHSPFAAAIARHWPLTRDSFEKAFAAIREVVAKQTDGNQQPVLAVGDATLRQIALSEPNDVIASETPQEGSRAGQHWVNGVGMVFCWCPPGNFTMGMRDTNSPLAEDAQPVPVKLTKGFWMAKYELTQKEYQRIRGRGPIQGTAFVHRNAPLTMIDNANDAVKWLNDVERKAGRLPSGWEYAIPTEAEWEYACRAGSDSRFFFGDSLDDLARYANFADRSLRNVSANYYYASTEVDDGIGARPTVVGSYLPNAWGLHDVHGNVSEWCRDKYSAKLPGGTDPVGVGDEGVKKEHLIPSVRGGAWCSRAEYCQAGFRNPKKYGTQTPKYPYTGVRVVLRRKS